MAWRHPAPLIISLPCGETMLASQIAAVAYREIHVPKKLFFEYDHKDKIPDKPQSQQGLARIESVPEID
jgi:hypothetical protein